MTDLLNRHCRPLEGSAAMTDREVADHLRQVSGWQQIGQAIEKTFAFKNYHETIAFVNALAWICHVQDHHPALTVTYNRCVVRFDTHSVGGISVNDFICAAKADNLVAFSG
jgi:4a-hydroxytetrahydrobiopterin dehydratase